MANNQKLMTMFARYLQNNRILTIENDTFPISLVTLYVHVWANLIFLHYCSAIGCCYSVVNELYYIITSVEMLFIELRYFNFVLDIYIIINTIFNISYHLQTTPTWSPCK